MLLKSGHDGYVELAYFICLTVIVDILFHGMPFEFQLISLVCIASSFSVFIKVWLPILFSLNIWLPIFFFI